MPRAEAHRFLLVPDVIAGSHHIGPGIDRLEIDVFSNAETTRSILAVDDDKIEFQVGDQTGQAFPDGSASRLANHVTQKKQSHRIVLWRRKGFEAAFGQNGFKPDVMRFSRHFCHLLTVECNADQPWIEAFLM